MNSNFLSLVLFHFPAA